MLVETSESQAPLTAELFEQAGLRSVVVRDEVIDAAVVSGVAH